MEPVKVASVFGMESSIETLVLDALVLPVFRQEAGEPPPKGIAKFCSAKDEEEAVLLAHLFQTIDPRYTIAFWFWYCNSMLLALASVGTELAFYLC